MLDLAVLIGLALAVAGAVAYVRACDILTRSPAEDDAP
jgi:hypothetical protein